MNALALASAVAEYCDAERKYHQAILSDLNKPYEEMNKALEHVGFFLAHALAAEIRAKRISDRLKATEDKLEDLRAEKKAAAPAKEPRKRKTASKKVH